MTFEEIQRTIEQMLAIQRELQESQLRLQSAQYRDREDIQQILAIQRDMQESQLNIQDSQIRLIEQTDRQQRILDRLIGYSITASSDNLNLEEKMAALEARVTKIEGGNN